MALTAGRIDRTTTTTTTTAAVRTTEAVIHSTEEEEDRPTTALATAPTQLVATLPRLPVEEEIGGTTTSTPRTTATTGTIETSNNNVQELSNRKETKKNDFSRFKKVRTKKKSEINKQ